MSKNKVEDVQETVTAEPAEKNLVYVHEPGTTHLNAYEIAVQDAERKVTEAKSELEAAKQALETKKATSQFVEE